MMIDKIGGVSPLNSVQNSRHLSDTSKTSFGVDSISVSQEARDMAEAYYMKQVADQTPDVRLDRVAEIKAKIQDPNYLNSAVISSAADKLMDSLGL